MRKGKTFSRVVHTVDYNISVVPQVSRYCLGDEAVKVSCNECKTKRRLIKLLETKGWRNNLCLKHRRHFFWKRGYSMIIAIKTFFLLVAIWSSLVYCGKLVFKNPTSAPMLIIQAISITGFICCQFFI